MNPALDRYVEENYDRLMAAAVNILGPDYAGDALHTVLLKLYGMDEERVAAMIESDYVNYYFVRSLMNERNDNAVYEKSRRNLPRYDDRCEQEDAPSLSEVLGRVKSAAYDAVSALVRELRLNARLNKILRYETTNMDRLVYQKVVMEGHSIRGLEKATGIPRSTLFESYTRVRKALAAEEKKYREELL